MNPASKSRTGGRRSDAGTGEVDSKDKTTPSTDMQPDDAGTPESGASGRSTAAQGEMKQAGKTDAQRGGAGGRGGEQSKG